MSNMKNEEAKKTTKLGQASTDGGLLAETRADAHKRVEVQTRGDGLSAAPGQGTGQR